MSRLKIVNVKRVICNIQLGDMIPTMLTSCISIEITKNKNNLFNWDSNTLQDNLLKLAVNKK